MLLLRVVISRTDGRTVLVLMRTGAYWSVLECTEVASVGVHITPVSSLTIETLAWTGFYRM